ncbi:hypothetical protein HY988_04080 [Candidatus Micrarchaeota archaeon]|nr:hypothetical protein [Candidatus Micrarchaeota archaeon]
MVPGSKQLRADEGSTSQKFISAYEAAKKELERLAKGMPAQAEAVLPLRNMADLFTALYNYNKLLPAKADGTRPFDGITAVDPVRENDSPAVADQKAAALRANLQKLNDILGVSNAPFTAVKIVNLKSYVDDVFNAPAESDLALPLPSARARPAPAAVVPRPAEPPHFDPETVLPERTPPVAPVVAPSAPVEAPPAPIARAPPAAAPPAAAPVEAVAPAPVERAAVVQGRKLHPNATLNRDIVYMNAVLQKIAEIFPANVPDELVKLAKTISSNIGKVKQLIAQGEVDQNKLEEIDRIALNLRSIVIALDYWKLARATVKWDDFWAGSNLDSLSTFLDFDPNKKANTGVDYTPAELRQFRAALAKSLRTKKERDELDRMKLTTENLWAKLLESKRYTDVEASAYDMLPASAGPITVQSIWLNMTLDQKEFDLRIRDADPDKKFQATRTMLEQAIRVCEGFEPGLAGMAKGWLAALSEKPTGDNFNSRSVKFYELAQDLYSISLASQVYATLSSNTSRTIDDTSLSRAKEKLDRARNILNSGFLDSSIDPKYFDQGVSIFPGVSRNVANQAIRILLPAAEFIEFEPTKELKDMVEKSGRASIGQAASDVAAKYVGIVFSAGRDFGRIPRPSSLSAILDFFDLADWKSATDLPASRFSRFIGSTDYAVDNYQELGNLIFGRLTTMTRREKAIVANGPAVLRNLEVSKFEEKLTDLITNFQKLPADAEEKEISALVKQANGLLLEILNFRLNNLGERLNGNVPVVNSADPDGPKLEVRMLDLIDRTKYVINDPKIAQVVTAQIRRAFEIYNSSRRSAADFESMNSGKRNLFDESVLDPVNTTVEIESAQAALTGKLFDGMKVTPIDPASGPRIALDQPVKTYSHGTPGGNARAYAVAHPNVEMPDGSTQTLSEYLKSLPYNERPNLTFNFLFYVKSGGDYYLANPNYDSKSTDPAKSVPFLGRVDGAKVVKVKPQGNGWADEGEILFDLQPTPSGAFNGTPSNKTFEQSSFLVRNLASAASKSKVPTSAYVSWGGGSDIRAAVVMTQE